ncbi:MutS protein msh5 [Gryganskiella cystojenkinii]|nr:MutS protein msh5 [Gryganskiella cystojenkinii]
MQPPKNEFNFEGPSTQQRRQGFRFEDKSDPNRPDYDHLATEQATSNTISQMASQTTTAGPLGLPQPTQPRNTIRSSVGTGLAMNMNPPRPLHVMEQQPQSTNRRDAMHHRNIDDFSSHNSPYPESRQLRLGHDHDHDQQNQGPQHTHASPYFGSTVRTYQVFQRDISSQSDSHQQQQTPFSSPSASAGLIPPQHGFSIPRIPGPRHSKGTGYSGRDQPALGASQNSTFGEPPQAPPSQSRATSYESLAQVRQSIRFSGPHQQQKDAGAAGETKETQPSEESFAREIIMVVNVCGRTVGCAYYDGQVGKLFVMNDMRDCDVPQMIEVVKAQLRPTLILTSSRTDESVLEILRFGGDGMDEETNLEVRPGNDFSYQLAKSRLVSVSVHMPRTSRTVSTASTSNQDQGPDSIDLPIHTSDMDERTQREAQLYLSNVIDLQSTESVSCAGAIVSFLSRHGLSHRTVRNGHSVMIISIASFSIDSFMFVNANTLSSLQIFEDESHPNMHSGFRGRKEGFSLYSILGQTKTSQGKYLLKQWLLRPSLDLRVIKGRHKTVECFTRTENQPTVVQLLDCLSHIKNIPKVLQALPRKATLSEWQAILQIQSISQEIFVGESPIMQQIRAAVATKDLNDIGTFINDVVDFDESTNEARCVVKHNVDEELDRMRQNYNGLDSFLSEIAKEISGTIPAEFTKTINVIYFPQLGYLITVPMNPEWKTEQDFTLEGLQYQFSTETTVYYKNQAMRELDEHLGDIHGLIVDREIDILQGLQERVLEYSHVMVSCSDLCAELDILVSFAQVARIHNFRKPTMTEENVVQILKGRHPLQEMVVNSFVPNDTRLGEIGGVYSSDIDSSSAAPDTATSGRRYSTTAGYVSNSGMATDLDLNRDVYDQSSSSDDPFQDNRVIILTGANSSGKSVYLKQVALITYMAHVGSFVPAESALVGLTDKILTRLQTRETVSCLQSAFMTDLQQVTTSLRLATRRSLIIMDEFGKGTTPSDGAGMFAGVIEHFAHMPRSSRPKVMATTHFHELLENNLLDLSLPISLYTMEVYQEPSGLEATFMFRVIPGKTPSSLGPACAAMASMPPHIVQRGIHLSNIFRRYETVVPQLTEYDQSLQKLYEELTAKLLSFDIDLSKLGNEVDDPLPKRSELENRLRLLDERSADKDDCVQDMDQEIRLRSLSLEEGENDLDAESILTTPAVVKTEKWKASDPNSTSYLVSKKRKGPPSDGLDDNYVDQERARLLMLKEMYDLMDLAAKVHEKEQEVYSEDDKESL